jgi:putative ubiquitin-RnfH superfamily antitoxin RatB of RatAB toxin-antitoxin module
MDNSTHSEAIETIAVEITYALPEKQTLYSFEVPVGTSLNKAIELSGIKAIHPELDLDAMKVGIFGKIASRERILEEKDRIELYRPLFADPKEIRKQRAAEGKTMKNRQKAKEKQL